MAVGGWSIATHWLAATGAVLLAVGSGAQAWAALRVYDQNLGETEYGRFVQPQFRRLRYVWIPVYGLYTLIACAEARRGIKAASKPKAEHIRWLKEQEPMLREDEAALISQGLKRARRSLSVGRIWTVIMYGAALVLVGAVLQLVID